MERPLFAMGSITDWSISTNPTEMPIIAVATGKSGELVRIAKAETSMWQWDDHEDACLVLPAVDPQNREEEVIWASDGLPITQIKAAVARSNLGALRWLFIQKQNSTSILQPEYRLLPTMERQLLENQIPSLISPRPLATLSYQDTGGNAHSDIVLGSTIDSQPNWVGLIDECGFWSLWDVGMISRDTQKNTKLSRKRCGHISDGILDEFPLDHEFEAERHGLIVTSMPTEQSNSKHFTLQSRDDALLVMWNRHLITVFDIMSDAMMGGPRGIWEAKTGSSILDVQLSKVDSTHVFILTRHDVIWASLSPRGNSFVLEVILTRSHHSVGLDDAKMFVSAVDATDTDSSIVYITSASLQQLRRYWFSHDITTGMPQWQQYISSIPGVQDFGETPMYQLDVLPVEIAIRNTEVSAGLGKHYLKQGIRFYQVNMLGDDLALRYCICASSQDSSSVIELPTKRIDWSVEDQRKRWKRKRRHLLRHIRDTFVLPDGMVEQDLVSQFGRNIKADAEDASESGGAGLEKPPLKVNLASFGDFLQKVLLSSIGDGELGIPKQLFATARELLNAGVANGQMGLLSWQQALENATGPLDYELPTNGMEDVMTELLTDYNDVAVIAQLRRFEKEEPRDVLIGLPYIYQTYIAFWLSPLDATLSNEMQVVRQIWASELARDMFLCSYGMMVQDVAVLGPQPSHDADAPQSTMPSSSVPFPSSSPQSSGQPESSDDAVNRLRHLAVSIRPNSELGKQADVLSFWPARRGTDTADYVSSVTLATEDKVKGAREAKQKKEARRRSQIDKFRRQSMMRQPMSADESAFGTPVRPAGTPVRPSGTPMRPSIGTPARPSHPMSSQQVPNSSQSQGPGFPAVTMSQPVSGLFGERKKAKKGKRKSGF